MKIIWLKGDYVKNYERQEQAKKLGCNFVISFHFNSAKNKEANGTEGYHNGKGSAPYIAYRLVSVISKVLGIRQRKIVPAKGTRAAFIDFYHCPAVLLEVCFISNPQEAMFFHDPDKRHIHRLGKKIADEILSLLPSSSVLGIDIGHKFKSSQPKDKGAKCVFGDYEADHAEQLANIVTTSIQNSTGGY